jgi:flavin-dependent dehydrogenase
MARFDLIVVGAGPGGLMAARTAAENGLKVCLVERRGQLAQTRRACCAQFIMDDGYENESLEVRDGKLVFPRNGFEVAYTGRTLDIVNKYYHSPIGNCIHFAHENGRPFAIKFDKGALLKSMLDDCVAKGVEVELGTVAVSVEDDPSGVSLALRRSDRESTLQGKKLVLAEGVNAHLSGLLGLNEQRKHIANALIMKAFVRGYQGYEPGSWNLYYGRAYRSNAAVLIGPSLVGDDVIEMTLMGNQTRHPRDIYKGVTTDSPLAARFRGSELIDSHCCGVRAYTPMAKPCRGNTIAIGDAAAYVETEVQGAISCGYRAAFAMMQELEGKPGFADYTSWWADSFEFNGGDFLRVAQGYALVPTYTDDELDYLFGLLKGKRLEGSYSQYKTPALIWGAILEHKAEIARKHPQLHEKIKRIDEMTLRGTF